MSTTELNTATATQVPGDEAAGHEARGRDPAGVRRRVC